MMESVEFSLMGLCTNLGASVAMDGAVQEVLGSLSKVVTANVQEVLGSLSKVVTANVQEVLTPSPVLQLSDALLWPQSSVLQLSDALLWPPSPVLQLSDALRIKTPSLVLQLQEALRIKTPSLEEVDRLCCFLAGKSLETGELGEVEYFTTEVLGLPRELALPVVDVLRSGAWREKDDPLGYIHNRLTERGPGRRKGSLTYPDKVLKAKVLRKAGFSQKWIAEQLGIGKRTIEEWEKKGYLD